MFARLSRAKKLLPAATTSILHLSSKHSSSLIMREVALKDLS